MGLKKRDVISGIDFWHNTEFGKALARVLPPKLTRVIIDIDIHDVVKIYYASIETGPILDLKWDEIIDQFEVVKPAVPAVPWPENEVIKVLEENSWDLRCIDIPTGGGDFDIGWIVVGHYLTEPKEHIIGRGKTPAEAIEQAQKN